jgi:hypothetical protein
MVRGLEVDIHHPVLIKKARQIGIIEWLDANDIQAGREAADGKIPIGVEREAADELTGARVECADVRAKQARAVHRHAAADAAGSGRG